MHLGGRAGVPEDLLTRLPASVILKLPSLCNSIGIELKLIPAGRFVMGEAGGLGERPHPVKLTKPFYIGVYEVTNAQWKELMGDVPSSWQEDDRPVVDVSWDDVTDFCRRLSELPEEKEAGRVYRLPTEAEWEYACRAGTKTKYCYGDDESQFSSYGWCRNDLINDRHTHPVGKKKPNAWGLFDMHGNVCEWCNDWHDYSFEFKTSAARDPQGPPGPPRESWKSAKRVHRGGSKDSRLEDCRSANREGNGPASRFDNLGFRLALSPSRAQSKLPEAVP
jgi:formylglycine-generating enzyme required for sulfatase activity